MPLLSVVTNLRQSWEEGHSLGESPHSITAWQAELGTFSDFLFQLESWLSSSVPPEPWVSRVHPGLSSLWLGQIRTWAWGTWYRTESKSERLLYLPTERISSLCVSVKRRQRSKRFDSLLNKESRIYLIFLNLSTDVLLFPTPPPVEVAHWTSHLLSMDGCFWMCLRTWGIKKIKEISSVFIWKHQFIWCLG